MDEPPKKKKNGCLIALLIAGGVIALAVSALLVAVYGFGTKFENKIIDYDEDVSVIQIIPPAKNRTVDADLSAYAKGNISKLQIPEEGSLAPDYVFKAPNGSDARFTDFRGKVVVVNLWAMWCAPCRAEMPTLAGLARTYADRDVVVVPINVDVTPEEVAKAPAFLAANPPLTLYSDPKFELPFRFVSKGGMPQTVLLDRQGRVRAALTGGGDWNSPEAHALIDALLAEPA